MNRVHRIALGYLIIVWIGASSAWCQSDAVANDGKRELVLAVAKVAANEGALWSLHDTDLIWQVVEHRGINTARRLEWLRRHSGRVLERKPCRRGNCSWSRNLSRRTGVVPAGIASGQAEWWLHEMVPRWVAVLERADALVRGKVHSRPCHIPPQTWGGRLIDVEQAARRGLYPIGCDERTLNDGFRYVGGFRW